MQMHCDVISEMLVARPRMNVIFTSRGLCFVVCFRDRVRIFFLKCRVSNPIPSPQTYSSLCPSLINN